MKRKSVKAILCVALMALTLSMTACGGSGNAAQEADNAAKEEASVEDEAPEEEESSAEDVAPEEEESPAEEVASVEEESSAEEEASVKEESTGAKTLEEYMKEDPTAEQQFKEQAEAQANDQMDMDVEVKGNEVICVATFKDSVELPDDVSEQLSDGMDVMGSTFSALAGMLDDQIGAEKGTVAYVIRYCASDGSVLAEASFRAE